MVKWNRKKTVTLLWDGEKWRDNETGVLVTGFAPPPPNLEKAEFVYDEPQFVEAGHFKTLHPTHDEVQQMIDDAFQRHTLNPNQFHYFVSDDLDNKFVNYRYHREAIRMMTSTINRLETEAMKPWWKRW